MRHIVNFGLLFAFITLAVTGVLSFVRPFSLVTTRIHIVFGVATFVLVGLHLSSRIPYFRQQLRSRAATHVSPRLLLLICLGWGLLLWASFQNLSPARALISTGYEARHRHEIVRPRPETAWMQADAHHLISARQDKETDTVAIYINAIFGQNYHEDTAMAIWAESSTGTMIETLYVSPSIAFSDHPEWGGKETPRSEILPVWRHRYTTVTGVDPSGRIDTTSGATEKHRFSLDEYMKVDADEYVVFLEVNAPQDTNEHWRDSHVGQPSVLYSALVDHRAGRRYELMELTGRGGGTESPGAIQYDMDELSSAKHLIEFVLLVSEELPR